MKTRKVMWSALLLALTLLSSCRTAPESAMLPLPMPTADKLTTPFRQGRITIRAVQGYAEYSQDGLNWHLLRANAVLKDGVSIRTPKDSYVDVLLSGAGVLRIKENTVLNFDQFDVTMHQSEVIVILKLTLVKGAILSHVQEHSPYSIYELKTL